MDLSDLNSYSLCTVRKRANMQPFYWSCHRELIDNNTQFNVTWRCLTHCYLAFLEPEAIIFGQEFGAGIPSSLHPKVCTFIIVYKMNMMLFGRRLGVDDLDHKQVRSRVIFLISLHTIRLLFATSAVTLCLAIRKHAVFSTILSSQSTWQRGVDV